MRNGGMATGTPTYAPRCSGPSLTVPFVEGRLTLDTWQQVVFVDFDVRPRQRQLVVQVMGE